MFTAPEKSFTIWLHEYKPRATRADGYAQTIHNHRYPMSALLLAGGYRYTRFAVQADKDYCANVRAIGHQNLTGGSMRRTLPRAQEASRSREPP